MNDLVVVAEVCLLHQRRFTFFSTTTQVIFSSSIKTIGGILAEVSSLSTISKLEIPPLTVHNPFLHPRSKRIYLFISVSSSKSIFSNEN